MAMKGSAEGLPSAASTSAPHALMVICPLVVHVCYEHFLPLSGFQTEDF